MRDADKVKIIEHIAVDVLQYCEGENADFYRGIVNAIDSICDYKEGQTDHG